MNNKRADRLSVVDTPYEKDYPQYLLTIDAKKAGFVVRRKLFVHAKFQFISRLF